MHSPSTDIIRSASPLCDLRSNQVREELLPIVPVEEVWGIGGASAAKLAKLGIQTAADLAALEPDDPLP